MLGACWHWTYLDIALYPHYVECMGPIENLACASLANTRHNLYYLLCGVIDAIVFIALCIQFVPYSSEFSSLLRISVL
jgi:hypothetical protein